MQYTIKNGELIEESKAKIPITNKAYFFDFAVYSSLKVIQGKIFFLEYHVDRLFESAKLINLGHSFRKEQVVDWLNLLVEKNKLKNAFLRIVLVGDATENKKPDLYIFSLTGVTFYSDKFYKRGVKVISYKGERRIPKAKTKDLLLSFLAFREAKNKNAIEALMIDNDGNIREGTRSNFFAIKGNALITPPKEKVLEGITRKMILQVAKKDFEIKEEDIPFSKIKEYDEFFITSTLFNALPINQIDDTKIESDFKKTKIIQKLFKDYYHRVILEKN